MTLLAALLLAYRILIVHFFFSFNHTIRSYHPNFLLRQLDPL